MDWQCERPIEGGKRYEMRLYVKPRMKLKEA